MKFRNISSFLDRANLCHGAGLLAFLLCSSTRAATFTWDAGGAGTTTWATAANWNPDGTPVFAAGDTFDLSQLNIVGNSTSTVSAATTLGSIVIGDTNNSNSWTLAGGNNLTMNSGGAGAATIAQAAGSAGDTISGSYSLLSNLSLSSSSATSSALVISGLGTVNKSDATLTVGSAGGLVNLSGGLSFNSFSGTTFATAGTTATNTRIGNVTFAGGTSAMTSSGSAFTLTGNVTNSSTNLQTITQNITLFGGTRNFTTTAGGGDIYLGGTFSGALNGGTVNILQKSGTGTLTLAGTNNTAQQITLTSGSIDVGSSGIALYNGGGSTVIGATGLIGSAGGGTIKINGFGGDFGSTAAGGVITINAVIADGPAKSGIDVYNSNNTGTVVMGGANTYTGTTNLQQGNLRLANSSALQNSTLSFGYFAAGALSFDSAVGTNAFSIGGLASTTVNAGNTFALANNAGTPIALTVGGNNLSNTYGGLITGAGSFTKSGTGVQTLSNVNTYTGLTTVNAGTLVATAPGTSHTGGITVGGTGNFTYRAATAGALNLGGGAINLADGSTLGTSVGGTPGQSAVATTGSADFTGSVNVNVVGNELSVTTGTNNLVTAGSGLDTGTVAFKIYNATNFTASNFQRTATAITADFTSVTALTSEYWQGGLTGGNNVWALTNGITASNWASDPSGTATSLTPGASATVTFTSGTAASGSATSTVLGANMRVAGIIVNDAAGVGLNADGYSLSVGVGGITVGAGAGPVVISAPVILAGNQAWTNDTANTMTVSGGASGGSTLTKAGAGTLKITGYTNYTGATTISAGTLLLSDNGSGDTIGSFNSNITNNSDLAMEITAAGAFQTFAKVIGGTGTVNVTSANAGTIFLNQKNTFTGNMTIDGGTARVAVTANNNGLGASLGNSVAGRTITINSGATLGGSVNNWFGNQTVADANLPAIVINGGTMSLQNNYTTVGALTLNNGATVTQSGMVALATEAYQGFALRGGVTVGGTSASTITTSGSVGYHLGANTIFSVSDVNGGPANDLLVSAPLRNQSGDFANAPGGLTKAGAGTMSLTGANTYTGATSVIAGKLVVTNSIGGSSVSVSNAGSTLATDAAATIGSTLTINSGGILALGDAGGFGTGTVNGATTFMNSSIFSWDINNDGSEYDRLIGTNVGGELTVGDAVFRIVASDSTFANAFWSTTRTWTDIFTLDGTTPVADWANHFSVSVVDSSFIPLTPESGSFSAAGNTLTWTAVPEPSTALISVFAVVGLLRRRRISNGS